MGVNMYKEYLEEINEMLKVFSDVDLTSLKSDKEMESAFYSTIARSATYVIYLAEMIEQRYGAIPSQFLISYDLRKLADVMHLIEEMKGAYACT